MIDVNELMVGDWVEPIGCSEKYSRVWEIYSTTEYKPKRMVRVINQFNYCLEGSDINPIPITVEFLEANGFRKFYSSDQLDYCWKRGEFESQGLIYIWPSEGSIHIRKLKASPYKLVEFELSSGVNYVHELQHILRACELDEIINNFILCFGK